MYYVCIFEYIIDLGMYFFKSRLNVLVRTIRVHIYHICIYYLVIFIIEFHLYKQNCLYILLKHPRNQEFLHRHVYTYLEKLL